MGRYFFHIRKQGFHIRKQGRLDPDDQGVELPDAEAAYEEAIKAARGIARDAALSGKDVSRHNFEVVNDNGKALFTFPFLLAREDGSRRSLH